MAARKRMGLQTIANVRAAMDKDSSETDVEKRELPYIFLVKHEHLTWMGLKGSFKFNHRPWLTLFTRTVITLLNQLEKSYYSLTYPTTESPGNLSEENADHDAAEQDVIGVENYSRIIEELQSHRREIEKLQMSNVSLDEVKEGGLSIF